MNGTELMGLKDSMLDLIDSDFRNMVDKLSTSLVSVDDDLLREVVAGSTCQHLSVHLAYHVNIRIDIEK